jgi:hypothetical protein
VLTEADQFCRAGTLFQKVGLYAKAISQYRTALKRDKCHASTHFNMATCLCYLADQSEGANIAVAFRRKARSHYVKATENAANGFGEAHSNLAVLYLKENMLDEALASCESALALHDIGTMPYNKAFWNLSSVLRRLGRKDAAIGRAWATIEEASLLNMEGKDTQEGGRGNTEGKERRNEGKATTARKTTTAEQATMAEKATTEPKEDLAPGSETTKQPHDTAPAIGDKDGFTRPTGIQCRRSNQHKGHNDDAPPMLSIVCVKWGTKYGPEYVKRLYEGVRRNISVPFQFVCFTEDSSGLEAVAHIQCMGLEPGWNGWWNKASLFSSSFPLTTRVLYIDLDTVVTGSIDALASYRGDFAILSTRGIDNEGKDFSNGYNSSILMWDAASTKFSAVCECLREHFDLIHRFIHRFDHWLEMMVMDADLVQDVYPTQVVDFNNACTVAVPDGARVVVFPLKPKPHEVVSPSWVQRMWTMGEEELCVQKGGKEN